MNVSYVLGERRHSFNVLCYAQILLLRMQEAESRTEQYELLTSK